MLAKLLTTFFFLLIAQGLYSAERIYGPEFTFTNFSVLTYRTISKDQSYNLLKSYQKNLISKITTELKKDGIKFDFKPLTSSPLETRFLFTFNDGFWFRVTIDVVAIEFQTLPGTVVDFKNRSEFIQKYIFNTCKSVGLTPHSSIGQGHINIGLEYFEKNPKQFRDFLATLYSHSELFEGIFGSDYFNSPPISKLPNENIQQLQKIFTKFDNQSIDKGSAYDLARDIENYVYNHSLDESSHFIDNFAGTRHGREGGKYQAISYHLNNRNDQFETEEVDYLDDDHFNDYIERSHAKRRVELRAIFPQENIAQFIEQIEFFDAIIESVKDTPLEHSLVIDISKKTKEEKIANFRELLKTLSVDQQIYDKYIEDYKKNRRISLVQRCSNALILHLNRLDMGISVK